MNKFNFNPPNGLLDTNAYPTNPSTEAEARGQIQAPLNQIKDYLNVLSDGLESSNSKDGYTKLPNGIIIQWGRVGGSFSNGIINKVVTYPKKFPANTTPSLSCSLLSAGGYDESKVILHSVYPNDTQFTITGRQLDLPGNYGFEMSWIAIGY
ncbi:hypothetical protein [uncultured Clostridium sp.]|uniref:gp53-like domain-containing protein n=1 Tax=uncultured Clostridium sp. TaxID=59620 RepID=UPI0025FBDFBA|nr:hypothetical protein [uncultured Clostridium sp.]